MRTYATTVCLCIGSFCFVNPDVTAQLITPVSQSRYVQADSNTQSSADFGPFTADVSAYGVDSSSEATQNSQINPFSITASGGARGSTPGGPQHTANSYFSVTFNVAVPSFFSLTGGADGHGFGGTSVSFTGPTGTIFQTPYFIPYSINGVLAAGQYVITVQEGVTVNGANHQARFTYNLDLELPPTAYQITAIALQSNDVLLTWDTFEGTTNRVQAASGAADGSYSNNFFTISSPIIIPGNAPVLVTTNYLDAGGATNVPARYYRVVIGTP